MREHGVWVLVLVLVLVLVFLASAASAVEEVAVSPHKSAGEIARYPRLTRFPDAQIQGRVNDLLAARDREERENHTWCETNLRENHQKMEKDSYFTAIEVTHISQRFLSIAITGEYYCGGAHPEHGPQEPLTIDLSQGKEVDWAKEFKPGFLGENGRLAAIYRKRYPRLRGNDPKDDCLEDMREGPLSSFHASLVSKDRGLTVEPELPYASQACAETLVFTADELAPYVRDPNLIAELRQMATQK
jgi:hypothetical protein